MQKHSTVSRLETSFFTRDGCHQINNRKSHDKVVNCEINTSLTFVNAFFF